MLLPVIHVWITCYEDPHSASYRHVDCLQDNLYNETIIMVLFLDIKAKQLKHLQRNLG